MSGLSLDVFSRPEELTHEGGVIAYATLASTVVGVGFCLLFARMRAGITLKEYFAWQWRKTFNTYSLNKHHIK